MRPVLPTLALLLLAGCEARKAADPSSLDTAERTLGVTDGGAVSGTMDITLDFLSSSWTIPLEISGEATLTR